MSGSCSEWPVVRRELDELFRAGLPLGEEQQLGADRRPKIWPSGRMRGRSKSRTRLGGLRRRPWLSVSRCPMERVHCRAFASSS
jgi:hypothetical protein